MKGKERESERVGPAPHRKGRGLRQDRKSDRNTCGVDRRSIVAVHPWLQSSPYNKDATVSILIL